MTSPEPAPIYHVAPTSVRASIKRYGIDPRRFAALAGPEYAGFRPEDDAGFFAFDSLAQAEWYANYQAFTPPRCAMDIWELRPTRPLVPDYGLWLGETEEDTSGSWFHLGFVRQVRLIRTIGP